METKEQPNVVVMGGGTGSFTVLQGLKERSVNLKAVVAMSDDGGSTGRLRDELGVLPPGDVRQCLVALSESSQMMRDLFCYRFGEGELKGHSFGNLFISALEKSTGSFAKALREIGKILSVKGEVIPVTLDNVDLVAELKSGKVIYGERDIDDSKKIKEDPIEKLYLDPEAKANERALQAIKNAEAVVIGPGSLYSSIVPLFLVKGVKEALSETGARVIYNVNLMTRFGHTDDFDVFDFVNKVEEFVGDDVVDDVIFNNQRPTKTLVEKYAQEGRPVDFPDKEKFKKEGKSFWGTPLLPKEVKATQDEADELERTLIRHDEDKLADIILEVLKA